MSLHGTENILRKLQSTLLQAGNAGEDPRGDALGRPADAASAPGAFHPACGSHTPV